MTDDVTTESNEIDNDRDVTIPGGQSMSSLERDARAVHMRAMRYSYSEISDALGYGGRSNAHRAVQRARARILKPAVMTHVATAFAELDAIVLKLVGIMARPHPLVSGGKIVRDEETGLPLEDAGPTLAALAQWRQVSESRRKLLGLDAATKLEITNDSEVDKAISDLVEQLENRGRAMEQRAARGES